MRTFQPTISRVLAEMEREIGFPLFVRDVRALTPTPEARDLHREVHHSFTSLDRIGSTAARFAAHEHGNIRNSAAPSISISILPTAIQRFLGHYPGVGVTLEVRTSQSGLSLRPTVIIDFVLISSKIRQNARATGRFIEVLQEIIAEISEPLRL